MNSIKTLFLMMLLTSLAACGGGGTSTAPAEVNTATTPVVVTPPAVVSSGNTNASNETPGSNVTDSSTNTNTNTGSTGGNNTGVTPEPPGVSEPVFVADTAQNRSYPLTWLPDASLLLAGNHDKVFKVWDGNNYTLRQAIAGHTDWVQAFATTADSRLVATGGRDGKIRFWLNANGALGEFVTSTGDVGGIRALHFSPAGGFIAVAGNDGKVQVWDHSRREVVHTWSAHAGSVYAVQYSPDGQVLASAGADGQIKLWNSLTGELLALLGKHQGAAYGLVFSTDGRQLISAGGDGQIRRWDMASRTGLGVLGQHDQPVYALALANDGVTLATGDAGGVIGIWSLPAAGSRQPSAKPLAGELSQFGAAGSGAVHALAFHPLNGQVGVTTDDAVLRIWSPANGQLLSSLVMPGTEGPDIPDDPVDNSPKISRQLAALVLDGMKPVLAIPDLLKQPERLTNAFLQNINQTTLSCPQGSYQYTFTDANNDQHYASANDDFAVNVAQCSDGDLTMTGAYGLRLQSNSQDLEAIQAETAVRLSNLLMDDGLTPATLTGNLDVAVTEPLDGINPIVALLTASQLDLQVDSNGTYGFSSLMARLETDPTTDSSSINYAAQLALQAVRGSLVSSGDYAVTTLEPVLLSSFEDYPYAGKLHIQYLKPRADGQVTVISALNSQQLKIETDKDGNGVTDHVQTVLWKNLIQPFH
jgi:WD40 repeat protein